MQKITFTDKDGYQTLASIKLAPAFNRWMYETVKNHCSGDILEIGSGIGNIAQCFVNDTKRLTLSDCNPEYYAYLKKHFAGNAYVKNILQIDLVHPAFNVAYKEYINLYDCVVTMNVVEHVEDDVLALKNINSLLKHGGILVMLVPANRFLYNTLDKALGHYRRYNRKMIKTLFEKADFEKQHIQYFNAAAIPGWFITGAVLKNTVLHAGPMQFYNSLVPLFKIVDRCLFHTTGISIIGVGTKRA
jgi:SAM-dependent methyltransferase